MLRSTKTFLNFILLFFAVTGFALIVFNDRIEHHLAVFIPMGVLFVYGFMVSGVVAGCRGSRQVERSINSIYFMGFLYTMMSFVAFFYRIKQLPGNLPDQLVVAIAFTYLVISISSSLGGIIIRRIVMVNYLRNRKVEVEKERYLKRVSGF